VDGDLDRLVAVGLGFDLAALRERADAVGLLPALQQARVPLAVQPGEAQSDKLLVPALRAALQGELRRTLGVAAPPKVVVAPRGARQPRAAPVPDALDVLIDSAPAEDEEDQP
jgi:hypothetical protein